MREKSGAGFDIGVDGCVNLSTVPQIVKAGANYLIAGSSVFGSGKIGENIKNLRDCAGYPERRER